MAGFIPDKSTNLAVAVASAATSVTWSKNDRLSIISNTNCWILTGTAPTAVAGSGTYVPAGIPMTIQISVDACKIAAIRATADGFLSISQAIGD